MEKKAAPALTLEEVSSFFEPADGASLVARPDIPFRKPYQFGGNEEDEEEDPFFRMEDSEAETVPKVDWCFPTATKPLGDPPDDGGTFGTF